MIAARNQVRGKTDQAASATPLSAILSKIAEIQAKQPTNNQISTSDLERNFASHTLNSLQSQTARQSQSPVFNSAQVLDVQRIAATLANPQNYNHSQHSLGPQDPKIQNVLAQIAQLNPVSAQETGYQNRGQQDGYWGGADNERRHWGRGQRDDYHGGVDDERDRNRGHHPGGDYDRRSEYKNGNGREYGRMRNEGDDRRGSFEGRRNVSDQCISTLITPWLTTYSINRMISRRDRFHAVITPGVIAGMGILVNINTVHPEEFVG